MYKRQDLRWACPRSRVTFDSIQVLQWAWHEVKGEAVAANEADVTSGIVLTIKKGNEGVKWVWL